MTDPERPARPGRTDPREITELRALKQQHPELVEAVNMHMRPLSSAKAALVTGPACPSRTARSLPSRSRNPCRVIGGGQDAAAVGCKHRTRDRASAWPSRMASGLPSRSRSRAVLSNQPKQPARILPPPKSKTRGQRNHIALFRCRL